jgi:enoyl-CoA hydratase
VVAEPLHTDPVLEYRRGPALWLHLNRPAALNGLNPDLIAALSRGLDAAQDESVHVVVVTGEGRAFCAGGDLAFAQQTQRATRPAGRLDHAQLFLREVRGVLDRIETFEKPVIAAVQGLAIGGGLELAMACDLIIAARSAQIGDGHAKFGQIPGGGATVRLPRRVGVSLAKRLMFTGELLAADAFVGTDLIDSVVDDDELVDAVDALVEQIAAASPVGLARMKMLINGSFDVPTAVGLSNELEQSALHQTSEDWHEGIAAFNEKRTPNFTGR